MVHVQNGLCVVFSNENFTKEGLTHRVGTNRDVNALKQVFEGLGYDFVAHKDLTGDDMNRALNDLMKKDYDKYDALFCFVLSHGEEEVILATDGKEIKLETIRSCFIKSFGLRNKPKLVFIQSCQGGDNSRLVQVETENHSNFDGKTTKSEDFDIDIELVERVSADCGSSVIPEEGDFMMILSSTPGDHINLTFRTKIQLSDTIFVRQTF